MCMNIRIQRERYRLVGNHISKAKQLHKTKKSKQRKRDVNTYSQQYAALSVNAPAALLTIFDKSPGK
jgi:hypothetical protein